MEEARLLAEAAAEQREDGQARAATARRMQVLHEGCAESLAEGRGPDEPDHEPDSPGEPTGAAVLEHSTLAVDASRRADAADEVAAAPTQLPPLHTAAMAVLEAAPPALAPNSNPFISSGPSSSPSSTPQASPRLGKRLREAALPRGDPQPSPYPTLDVGPSVDF